VSFSSQDRSKDFQYNVEIKYCIYLSALSKRAYGQYGGGSLSINTLFFPKFDALICLFSRVDTTTTVIRIVQIFHPFLEQYWIFFRISKIL